MRIRFRIATLILLLPLAAKAQQQQAEVTPKSAADVDWARVQGLVHGEKIEIRDSGGRRHRCEFAGALAGSVFCNPYWSPPMPRFDPSGLDWVNKGEFQIKRFNIESIRLNQEHRNRWLITGASAAAGFGLGYARNPIEAGAPRAVGGVIGSGVFALGGSLVSLVVSPLIPGKLLYGKRSSSRNGGSFPAHSAPSTRPPPSGTLRAVRVAEP